jgi:hypothetical protein
MKQIAYISSLVSSRADGKKLIILRIDVDYPYPSRIRSFLYTSLGIRTSKEYLKNSKIVARMINESPREVKAFWFFTVKTIPDKELLALLSTDRHEVALHVVNDPLGELKILESSTGRKIRYYTVHGTARLAARVMWGRWRGRAPVIPKGFPLKSFHEFPTVGIDSLCFSTSPDQVSRIAKDYVEKGYVLIFHPIWLFQRGKLNQRGPFYPAFKKILSVDSELDSVIIRKKFFLKVARNQGEYKSSVLPTTQLLQKLAERGTDVFEFLERKWCCKTPSPQEWWAKADDNIALFHVKSYDEWWNGINKKTRNMIRKAEKSGISTCVAEPDEKLAKGIWKIYNETPIRQDRGFPHYGASLEEVRESLRLMQNCTYVGAYLQDELVGFIQLVHGDNITIISQILSMQKNRDKAVNNALVAKAIQVCADQHVEWMMYGRIGNHPSLDSFKRSNGFEKFPLTRYYIPITGKGKIVVKLGLQKDAKDALPQSIKYPLIPIYNWISRTKMRMKLHSQRGQRSRL